MGVCRVCQATDVHAAHRRNWLERGPLTWCGILPYRCNHCHARFYRLARRDPRRRLARLFDPSVAGIRAPRWGVRMTLQVTAHPAEGAPLVLAGETDNLSVRGARVRLPTRIPVGTAVRLAWPGDRAHTGIVRWTKPDDGSSTWHGVEFDVSLDRGVLNARPLRRLYRRRFFRRLAIYLIALTAIALTVAGLVWLLETFHQYTPKHYEPKDVERERYETQRRATEGKPDPQQR